MDERLDERLTIGLAAGLGSLGFALLMLGCIYVTGWAPYWVLSLEARLFRLFKRRKKWSWTKVDEGVFIGSVPRWPEHLAELRAHGVGAVLSVVEAWELQLSPACVVADCGMQCRHVSVPDFFAPTHRQIVEAVAFMAKQLGAGHGVYVHCNGGRGRSAVMVICYLVYARGLSADDAFALVRGKRGIANLEAGCGLRTQWRAVRTFERELHAVRAELAKGGDARAHQAAPGPVGSKASQVVPFDPAATPSSPTPSKEVMPAA